MKILLVAYACEPNRGSEPGVGWKWALNMANDASKEVYVLTRGNNKDVIDEYWTNNVCPKNLHFLYYDLSSALIWAKHHGFPVNLYYAWWLIRAVNYVKKIHKEHHFDMAHHLTFGTFRDPCPLYKLNIPYAVGPVGGGETTPDKLLPQYSTKEKMTEKVRSLVNWFALFNPTIHKTLNHASLILSKTVDTMAVLKKWHGKTIVNLEIGIDAVNKSDNIRDKELFLFVGRFIYWKGVRLALESFKVYATKHSNARLLMIGKGDMEGYIKKFATANNLNIEIIPWIPQTELKKYYSTACAMVFPSLHDSSGNVVLEALSFGLPVVCLDCGGPASVMGAALKDCIVDTHNKGILSAVSDIAAKMDMLSTGKVLFNDIQEKAYQRAESLLWKNTVSNSYKLIEDKLFCK